LIVRPDVTVAAMILPILSGGQTGVQRGVLEAPLERNFPGGGWCPRGRKAENGRNPDRYPLQEMDALAEVWGGGFLLEFEARIMKDENKTKAQLIEEREELRQRNVELESLETQSPPSGVSSSSLSLREIAATIDVIPLPATLIDTQEIIISVNPAFGDHANHRGYGIRKEDRIGHPITAFAVTEESRIQLESLLHALWHQGDPQHRSWRSADEQGTSCYNDIHADVLRDAEGQIVGALILREDETGRIRQEHRKACLERVRNALWRMSGSQDIHQVLQVIYQGLKDLCPTMAACSVQVVAEEKGDGISYQISERRVHEIYAGPVAGTPVEECWR